MLIHIIMYHTYIYNSLACHTVGSRQLVFAPINIRILVYKTEPAEDKYQHGTT